MKEQLKQVKVFSLRYIIGFKIKNRILLMAYKNIKWIYLKTILLFVFFGLQLVRSEPMNNIKDVSIIELIATPNKFNGQHVRLIGYAVFGFEVSGIFLSANDSKHSIMKNALWISLNQIEFNKYKKLNEQYILLEGIFNSSEKGHFGMYSGAIESVNRIMLK